MKIIQQNSNVYKISDFTRKLYIHHLISINFIMTSDILPLTKMNYSSIVHYTSADLIPLIKCAITHESWAVSTEFFLVFDTIDMFDSAEQVIMSLYGTPKRVNHVNY